MIFKNDESSSGELNGFLDSGSRLVGELSFDDTFRIDGRLEGSIESAGKLVVGEKGEIEGEVRVARIYVAGTVRGTIAEAEKVEISSSGKVFGDVRTRSLVVEDGAVLEGSCSMGEAAVDTAQNVDSGLPKAVVSAS